MKIPPFFCADAPAEKVSSSQPTPPCLPFHDNYECPVGQEVKLNRTWQYYEPTQLADTRPRCSICIELHWAGQ